MAIMTDWEVSMFLAFSLSTLVLILQHQAPQHQAPHPSIQTLPRWLKFQSVWHSSSMSNTR